MYKLYYWAHECILSGSWPIGCYMQAYKRNLSMLRVPYRVQSLCTNVHYGCHIVEMCNY